VKDRPHRDADRLAHLVEAIDDIQDIVSGGRAEFLASRRDQLAVRAALEVMGEAARHLSEGLKERTTQIDWNWLIEFRNRAIHEYFGVEPEELWEIVRHKLPTYRARLRNVRARR
jgi:uncharacterized protein with HEPN domain